MSILLVPEGVDGDRIDAAAGRQDRPRYAPVSGQAAHPPAEKAGLAGRQDRLNPGVPVGLLLFLTVCR